MKKLLLILFAVSLFSLGCNQENDTESFEENATAANETNDGAESGAESPGSVTSIEFEETTHDFGLIHKGNMVSHTFTFTNTGDAPLILSDIKTSCGCTTPSYTQEPVEPGEEGEIEVTYNGSGNGNITKTITVYANTEPETTKLKIKANVKSIDSDMEGPVKQ